ncbi:CobW family GTP-binding protein [Erwinia sp. V71]|uniref:CobW family GTP-binding protein n=1 Tax=Erwinia sp. V71 TaxID=3369424 RepID=UPI003F608A94
MKQVPLTLLNGFLGAGKTTLLKSLLAQAHQRSLAVCIIVNDMSELDVDGVLIANSEIVSAAKQNFVTISADSISSPSGIEKLDAALTTLLAHQTPDLILLETSGSSHPLPLVKYFRQQSRVSLRGYLALVDSVMLDEDYAAGSMLIPRLQHNLQHGRRGIENLLAEQMMFCSHLLLTKSDRLPFPVVSNIAQAIHPLNPLVAVMAVPWGNLPLDDVLAMDTYDFHRVTTLIHELEAEIESPSAPDSTQSYDIASQVLADDRPFHPQRLWDTYQQFLGRGIYRSKGFFWLPTRDDLALLWNQAAGSISLEFISYWKAGVLQHRDNQLSAEERALLTRQLQAMPGRFGDRRCRLTVIGQRDELTPFVQALQRCFLTEEEIAWWQEGGQFTDPWPQRVVRLTS